MEFNWWILFLKFINGFIKECLIGLVILNIKFLNKLWYLVLWNMWIIKLKNKCVVKILFNNVESFKFVGLLLFFVFIVYVYCS